MIKFMSRAILVIADEDGGKLAEFGPMGTSESLVAVKKRKTRALLSARLGNDSCTVPLGAVPLEPAPPLRSTTSGATGYVA